MINWQPIATLPEDRKDGRRVFVWNDEGHSAVWCEDRWWDSGPGWNDTREGGPIDNVTHWVDINPPANC